MDMDFCDVDHPYSSDLYSQIMQNENWDGWGLRRVQEQFENLFTALVTIAGGLLLSVTLFTSKVPDAGGLSFLNHPLCLAAVFAAMLAAAVFSPLFSNKAGSYWGKYAKDATFGNRVFSYFGFIAEAERERAMEIRTYGQEQLFRRKMQAENTFGHKSKIALWSRGIMGFYQSVSSILSRAFTGIVYLFVCGFQKPYVGGLSLCLPESLGGRIRSGIGHPVYRFRYGAGRRRRGPDPHGRRNAQQCPISENGL